MGRLTLQCKLTHEASGLSRLANWDSLNCRWDKPTGKLQGFRFNQLDYPISQLVDRGQTKGNTP